jgi:hypothetical protein
MNDYLRLVRFCRIEQLEARIFLTGNHNHDPDVPDVATLETIVDDADVGYSDLRWTKVSGSGYEGSLRQGKSGFAFWNFGSELANGEYRVLTTWTPDQNRATDVAFIAFGKSMMETLDRVNQRVAPDDQFFDGTYWEELGTIEISNGDLYVAALAGHDGLTIADAIRIERVEEHHEGPAIYSAADGPWSDPQTWENGTIPTAVDDVVITHNVTIDQAVARQVEIVSGTTSLAGELHAHGSVIVRSRMIGSEGAIYFHVADDRAFVGNTTPGLDPSLPDFHPEDIGLWAMPGSEIRLQGEYVTPWVDAVGGGAADELKYGITATVAIGNGVANLASVPVGWKAGDTLLLVNERGEHALADLISVRGTRVEYQLQSHGASDFIGRQLNADDQTVRPKVANLSRRLQIISADVTENDPNHRAHTLFFGGSKANVENVEFRDLGPRGKLGRYPVHFHHGGQSDSSLIGSSIWQDVSEVGNRFVALHAVQEIRVNHNVGFGSRGHGFFMEDGDEFGNEVIGNLSVNVQGAEELAHADERVSETHHFWLRAGNTIQGNVAAGNQATGLVILPSKAPPGLTTVVTNHVSLGSLQYGIWVFAPSVIFENPIVAYAEQAGFAVSSMWGYDSSGVELRSPLLLLNGENSPSYSSQIFLNSARDVSIVGGTLLGLKGLHTHYLSDARINGTRIDVGTLMTPTYWESEVIIQDAVITAITRFDQAYPIRGFTPGILRIVNSTTRFGTAASPSIENADYTGRSFAWLPGFDGQSIDQAWRLNRQALHSGFVKLPENARAWSVTPYGGERKSPLYAGLNRLSEWENSETGYPHGLPSGVYQIEAFDSQGDSMGVHTILVRVDQVTVW